MGPGVPSFGCDEGVWQWRRGNRKAPSRFGKLERKRARSGSASRRRQEMTGDGPAAVGVEKADGRDVVVRRDLCVSCLKGRPCSTGLLERVGRVAGQTKRWAQTLDRVRSGSLTAPTYTGAAAARRVWLWLCQVHALGEEKQCRRRRVKRSDRVPVQCSQCQCQTRSATRRQ
jgi:hypothetical protein